MGDSKWRGTVEMIRRTETAKGRADSGYFSIEGIRLHERALRAGLSLEQVITTASFLEDKTPRIQSLLVDLKKSATPVQVVPQSILKEITGKRDLGPILGLVKFQKQLPLSDVVRSRPQKTPLVLVALDVREPGNVGALLRTAHASGATAFVAVGLSDPYHPKALRTSMGSLFKLPVLRYEQPSRLMEDLKACQIESVGTAVSAGKPLPEAIFSDQGSAVFIGSESWGLSQTMQTTVDFLVSIPMASGVDSLSVNAAAAIVLYEIRRQGYCK